MKSFIEYLTESQEEKVYTFKVKVAGEIPDHTEDVMETCLQKYKVLKLSKGKTSPIQAKLNDFPDLENESVTVFEVDLNYPVTSTLLTQYISEHTGINASRIRVRSNREEDEAIMNAESTEKPEKYKPLLNTDYNKENNQKLVGQEVVGSLLKLLSKERKDHQPTQYKGVNDQLLNKKPPVETEKATVSSSSSAKK